MKVWVDLANSPHPLLFAPIVAALEQRGHTLLLTARDSAQTAQLARSRWNDVDIIGGPTPRDPRAKAQAIVDRGLRLRRWARDRRPAAALSHNSYAQIAAARSLRVPVVTAMDFEHQPSNHFAFRLAHRILLPSVLSLDDVSKQGATTKKVRFYPGLKEDLYLGDFMPDDFILEQLGLSRQDGKVIVVSRPAPSRAIYHQHGNDLYVAALRALGKQSHVQIVLLPRFPEQREQIAALELPNAIVPDMAVDTRSLMYAADLVIGAGGTMTREAALLGVPTLTVFAGRPPAVDRWLASQGLLNRLGSPDELSELQPRRRPPHKVEVLRAKARPGVALFVSVVEEFM